MVSFRAYAFGSALVAAGVVGKMYQQHQQYYPTVVALTHSKAANLVRSNISRELLYF